MGTVKVKMKTTAAGPGGVLMAGNEYFLPEDQARKFVKGGYAVHVKVAPPPKPEVEEAAEENADPETAEEDEVPAEENTAELEAAVNEEREMAARTEKADKKAAKKAAKKNKE